MAHERDFWVDPLDVPPPGEAPPVGDQIRALGRILALGPRVEGPVQNLGKVGIEHLDEAA